jgi:hypothetical protein
MSDKLALYPELMDVLSVFSIGAFQYLHHQALDKLQLVFPEI